MSPLDGPLVIVGGGPAGLATARAYRKAGGRAPVTLLTDEPHLPYERPPLTKDYLQTGEGRDELSIEPEHWFDERRVELRHVGAVDLDPDARRLTLEGGEELFFGACVLATGSAPVRPDVPGAELDGVHVMRTLADADALRDRIADGSRRAVVIGSGFIGCEVAASLRTLGCEVVLVSGEPTPQAARLGEEAGDRIAGWLRDDGVELRFGVQVTEIRRADEGLEVLGDDGSILPADLVVLGAGARARTALAEAAGLSFGEDGTGIVGDAELTSSHPRVHVAGDLARVHHRRAGRGLRVEHWGDALAHGEALGQLLAGEQAAWDTVPGFWSTIGERTLKLKAWGDGWDDARLVDHAGGGFTVYYTRENACVGVLTHEADDDHEAAEELVGQGRPAP